MWVGMKNHKLYRGAIPLWNNKHPHYMFRSGINLYSFTHSKKFFNNVLVDRDFDLLGRDNKQYINRQTLNESSVFKNLKTVHNNEAQKRAIKLIKSYLACVKKYNTK